MCENQKGFCRRAQKNISYAWDIHHLGYRSRTICLATTTRSWPSRVRGRSADEPDEQCCPEVLGAALPWLLRYATCRTFQFAALLLRGSVCVRRLSSGPPAPALVVLRVSHASVPGTAAGVLHRFGHGAPSRMRHQRLATYVPYASLPTPNARAAVNAREQRVRCWHHKPRQCAGTAGNVCQMKAFPDVPSSPDGKSSVWPAPACSVTDPTWQTCQDETWRALVELRNDGKIRAIGMLMLCATVQPAGEERRLTDF